MSFTTLPERKESTTVNGANGVHCSFLPDQENRIGGTKNTDTEMIVDSNGTSISNSNWIINGKEKSPMCLVNELCRFNSITCRYELIEESGAPHSRIFSVLLKLGNQEEYQASAPSIRKAQHAAASLALVSTKFPLPSPKSERKANKCSSQLTPTVELNVLAMKRREQVQYHVIEQPVRPNVLSNMLPFASMSNQMTSNPGDFHDFRNPYHQRFHLVRGMISPCYIATVVVGDRQFTGKGKTIQIARHSAAEEALKTIRHLPLSSTATTISSSTSAPVSLIEIDADDDDSKSPVSMIYEAAMKRKYLVQFEVISESGPSHMPCFVVKCIVGSYSAEGRGVRKKTAKRRAAALVLAQLEEKEPIFENSPQAKSTNNNDSNLTSSCPSKDSSKVRSSKKKSPNKTKKKKQDNRNPEILNDLNDLTSKLEQTTISSVSESTDHPEESKPSDQGTTDKGLKPSFSLNPISRLLQLQMAKKESEPKFKLVSEKDIEHRRKEFTIQCTIDVPKSSRLINTPTINNELSTFGIGSNKKIAKRKAAEEMLTILGYSSTATSSLSSSSSTSSTIASLSPILKMSTLSTDTEHSSKPCHPNYVDLQPTNGVTLDNPQPVKIDPSKERRVKFMEDLSSNSKENRIQSLTERLENLTELSHKQLLQSDSPNKYGRQIAPGLLFVMSMNQTSGYPIQLMDNTNNNVD